MAKYRIEYISEVFNVANIDNVKEHKYEFEKDTDKEAEDFYLKFRAELECLNDPYGTRNFVYNMVRIDQEEKTTLIVETHLVSKIISRDS